MTEPTASSVLIILTQEESLGRIMVGLDSFLRFQTELEKSLAVLEAKVGVAKTTISQRATRTARRKSK